ncbi:hypothetical protein A8L45_04220 [Veronia pacifica]|uniref:Uncharacterized protein n=1 Tax=Veronia pacifica TaxID=1080227 RepID=A0A1C3EQ65_9GAMM|nr:hypothetical protein A8L45_04220 [Veronia pacifica]
MINLSRLSDLLVFWVYQKLHTKVNSVILLVPVQIMMFISVLAVLLRVSRILLCNLRLWALEVAYGPRLFELIPEYFRLSLV